VLNTGVKSKTIYNAFGLAISSEIPFHELMLINDGLEPIEPELEIVVDPYLKHGFSTGSVEFIVDQGTVTFQMPDAGVFRVSNGNQIIVSPYASAYGDIIRLYILGTCMGIVLMQRSLYPLHGSAVVVNGKAYAFVGESGAGKSTLASAFAERGHTLLTDDIVALSFTESEHYPLVTPSYPQQKLWLQSLDALGINHTDLRSIYGRETKYCVGMEDKYCSVPMRLAGIFELEKTEENGISIQKASKLASLQLLFQHTYRQFLIPKLSKTNWHFSFSSKLGERLPIYTLKRSSNEFSAPQLVDLILKTIAMEE